MEGWFEKTHGKKATDDAATVFAAIGKLYATLTLDEASDLFDGAGNGETAGADFRKALEDPEAAFGDAWKASGCEVVGGELRSSAEDWENRAFSGPISAGRAMLANSSNGPYKPEFEALRALRWQGWLETDGTAVVLDLAERAGMWDAEEFVGEIAARAAMEPNLKEIARDAVVGIGEAICESRGETTEEELVGIFAAVTSAMNGFRSAFTAGWTYEEFCGKIAMADGSSSLEEAVRGVTEGLSEDVLVYDIGLGRYDHHQSEEIKARRENGMAYCGAGLIWRDFGRDVLSRMGIEEEIVDRVWKSVEARLVLGVDGRDNGVDVGGTYEGMDVSSIVRAMNPGWDEDAGSDERFLEAVRFMDGALRLAVKSAASAARARRFVEEAIGSSDGVVLELDRYVPWQGALAASENPKAAGILYAIFPSVRGGYNAQAVPVSPESFETRKAFPAGWRGKSAEELSALTGTDCTFVHPSGFLAAADTLEGARRVAKASAEA